MPDAVLTPSELAAELKVGEDEVAALAAEGAIPSFRVAGRLRFRRADVDQWIAEQTGAGVTPGPTGPPATAAAKPATPTFTKTQLDAIRHDGGNLQLIACAGSGKTEVVARRVAYLLRPDATPRLAPRNLVAFTFTEKAAAELKERIVHCCRQELGEVVGLAEMYVGTIHGFCLDLLKTEMPEYLKYEVLNEVQQVLFVDRSSKKSGLTSSTDLKGQPLKRYTDTPRYIGALAILRESDLDEKALEGCSILSGLEAYQALTREKRYLDYSSILELAVDALLHEEGLRERLRERIRHVIVDEYQDVNPIQEGLVWALHELGAAICVVGDDDQTIYQWRGSDVGNILRFVERYPDVAQIRLEENFRSSPGVVETARDFIQQNAERLPKAMIPAGEQVYEDGDVTALGFADPDAEAEHIVRTMQALRGLAFRDRDRERGLAWSDMAVLLRSVRANGKPITDALDRAKIPYVVAGMNNLFATPEAEAARQLFYLLAGRDGIDDATVLAAWDRAATGAPPRALKAAVLAAAKTANEIHSSEKGRFSSYSIQRVFMTFLEDAGIREELVPADRPGGGEVLFYNLGKLSQVISDFEAIHYHSSPPEKYDAFAGFLQYHADDAYPEGWQDNQYASPDAVRILTVHQAKGMQWPAVFLPALLKNRFPSKRQGGRNVWHLLPADGVKGQARFVGSLEDERRLFYVALTRSQKFLHLSWAPIPGNQQAQKPSQFLDDARASKWVKRREPDYQARKRLPPEPRRGVANVVLTFSNIKYFFECPYQFKLRILYGFNAPIHEGLGFGKSLHDVLADVHARALRKEPIAPGDAEALVATHLHTPYAFPALKEQLTAAAEKVVRQYIADNAKLFDKIELTEKTIEVNLGDGVSVAGRIDLVRRLDTDETTIVDFKSKERVQAEAVTETQLSIYALGYQELTGRSADQLEVYDLDAGKGKKRSVDDRLIDIVKLHVRTAADALRRNHLPADPEAKRCESCDYCNICSAGRQAVEAASKPKGQPGAGARAATGKGRR